MAKQQPKITESTISVILPTRGRRDVLITSIKSLVDKASNPARLEIIFGVDEDDTGINEFIAENLADYLNGYRRLG